MTLLLSISIATVMGFSFPASVHSHKNGAPVKACGFMNPGHGVAGQHSASPFVVTPSQTTYQCRETIKGMLKLLLFFRTRIILIFMGHFKSNKWTFPTSSVIFDPLLSPHTIFCCILKSGRVIDVSLGKSRKHIFQTIVFDIFKDRPLKLVDCGPLCGHIVLFQPI